ncbi:FG-GAP repeat domain-containing protein [Spirosoma sordidisoli]|uniref:VCBS repeat-containing protein n=1 Tax=Spirosoma sordidisoli TaxID=2502893 RepID=A0A4Q2UPC0_9BACT|nr:VCBS repeat-containing protein [Spirosoma sordidisoli]RYC71196.1 VCBS repeat-containing protein [Spirosoma sordidisoli]
MSWVRLVGVVCGSVMLFVACQSSNKTDTAPTPPAPTQLSGQQLAQTYCGSCHLQPAPALLDKATWQNGVLPQMALRLGQSDRQMEEIMRYSNTDELKRLIEANIFPEHPTLHPSDWQKIVAYYVAQAPDSLPAQAPHTTIQSALPLFTAHASDRSVDGLITLLTYDSLSHRIWAADARGNLFALNKRLQRTDSLRTSSPVVDLRSHPDGRLDLLTVGILNPNDQPAGSWETRSADRSRAQAMRVTNLQRPVQTTIADLNRDGREDALICEFGHHLGKLSWHEQLKTGYREHVLDAVPGARVAYVRDVNHDQWPDVVALLTQGDEQVAVYYNQRNGSFRKETVLRFPPVYGSSYLELIDLDRDGDDDLIYTNGDNADYSLVLKPYHGIRIFQNDGRFRFRQTWFYPMHGASQTVVRDFDQDGDPDLAAIAHFPDFSQRPYAGFIYFENRGSQSFMPRSFPAANRGRWLRLAAGDVDQDGDDDILLGSFFRPTGPGHTDLMDYWRRPGSGIMLLENKLR